MKSECRKVEYIDVLTEPINLIEHQYLATIAVEHISGYCAETWSRYYAKRCDCNTACRYNTIKQEIQHYRKLQTRYTVDCKFIHNAKEMKKFH